MPQTFDQHTALISGSNGAIGAAIAERLHKGGARVVLAVHNKTDRAAALAKKIGAPMLTADLACSESIEALVAEAATVAGPLTILVNNAALQTVAPWADLDADRWDALLATNLRAAHLLTRAVAPLMAQQGGGAVVNIASIEGHQPAEGHAHYAASKAGLLMATRSAALELGSKNIRVNSVSPGLIDDGTLAERWPEGVARWEAAAPLRRLGTPQDVAEAVAFLASSQASWVTGTDLVVDGGILARPTW